MYRFPCSFKNTLFLGKNILEASGIKSTELWPLMEFEALRSGLIGRNPFLFLFPWLYPLHTVKKQLPTSPCFLKQEYLILLNLVLWLLLSLSFSLEGEEKLSTCVQSKLNYEENSPRS